MPVTLVTYNNDPSIIVYIFYGDWTWEQFYKIDHEAWQDYTKQNKCVDLILDMSDCDEIPSGMTEILHRVGQRSSNGQNGLGIFVNAPLSIQVMVRALKRMYTEKRRIYEFVDHFDDAIDHIYKHRETTSSNDV